jgi:tripartite-type tricarboxylate transporter receptor subunit TctC
MNPALTRRQLLGALAVPALTSLPAAPAAAQTGFPDRPLKIIVPWAPGGSTDTIARALAAHMSETLKQQVIIDNRAGAAGQIGTDAAAKAEPDGHTLTILELPHLIAPAVVAKLPYDVLRDFTPITMLGTSPLVLFAHPNTPDLKAYLQAARTAAAPPAIAHSGSGSVSHLAGELLARAAGVPFTMVPYRGSAPALTDVAAGNVSAHFATMASGAALLSGGKVKALAVASASRADTPALREVPTFGQAGIKGLEVNQWWALVAPATTPIAAVERLRSAAAAALADAKVAERLTALAVNLKASSRDELRSFMRAEATRWQAVAREVKLTPQ